MPLQIGRHREHLVRRMRQHAIGGAALRRRRRVGQPSVLGEHDSAAPATTAARCTRRRTASSGGNARHARDAARRCARWRGPASAGTRSRRRSAVTPMSSRRSSSPQLPASSRQHTAIGSSGRSRLTSSTTSRSVPPGLRLRTTCRTLGGVWPVVGHTDIGSYQRLTEQAYVQKAAGREWPSSRA